MTDAPTIDVWTAAARWIVIRWEAPDEDYNYVVHRTPAFPQAFLVSENPGPPPSFTDQSCQPATTYVYYVKFTFGDGTTQPSNSVTVTTPPADAPSGDLPPPLIAEASSEPANINEPNRIIIGWVASHDYDAINVLWGPDGENQIQPPTIDASGRSGSFTAQPSRPDVRYRFVVQGGVSDFFGGHHWSAWSAPVTAVGSPNTRSLRQFLSAGGVDPAQGIRHLMEVKATNSLLTFMHL